MTRRGRPPMRPEDRAPLTRYAYGDRDEEAVEAARAASQRGLQRFRAKHSTEKEALAIEIGGLLGSEYADRIRGLR